MTTECYTTSSLSYDILEAVRELQKTVRWQKTTTRDNVHPIMKEFNIECGYRHTGRRWRYYLASAFQLHNESMNFLTHFAGGLILLAVTLNILEELQPTANKDDLQLLWYFACSSVCLQFVSAAAHLVHSKSELVHCLVFFADNMMVGMAAMASNYVMFIFGSTTQFFSSFYSYLIPIQVIGAFISTTSFSTALARYRRSYNLITTILMFGPTVLYCSFGLSPLVHRLYIWHVHDIDTGTIWYHFISCIILLLGTFFYGSYFPERFKKGYFDIFGHSHQWFHMCATLCHYSIVKCIAYDIKMNSLLLYSKKTPVLPLQNICASFGVLIAADAVVVFVLIKLFKYDAAYKSKIH